MRRACGAGLLALMLAGCFHAQSLEWIWVQPGKDREQAYMALTACAANAAGQVITHYGASYAGTWAYERERDFAIRRCMKAQGYYALQEVE